MSLSVCALLKILQFEAELQRRICRLSPGSKFLVAALPHRTQSTLTLKPFKIGAIFDHQIESDGGLDHRLSSARPAQDRRSKPARAPDLLVDVGDTDPFIEKELRPQLLERACGEVGQPIRRPVTSQAPLVKRADLPRLPGAIGSTMTRGLIAETVSSLAHSTE
jgi:hypothetical protein